MVHISKYSSARGGSIPAKHTIFITYIAIAESGILEDSQDSVISTTSGRSGLLFETTSCNSSILLVIWHAFVNINVGRLDFSEISLFVLI